MVKRALITGSTGGIGSDLAGALAQRGMRLILVDLDAERLVAQRDSLPGADHEVYAVNLAEIHEMTALVDALEREHSQLDLLVNAAGIIDNTPFEQRSVESIERELRVNLHAPIVLTRLLLPLLHTSGDAHVITLGSLGGVLPMPGQELYAASKFGIRGAMLSLAMSLRDSGVRVTTILPSAVDTPMLWQEVAENGNALQFLGAPQTPAQITACILRALERQAPEAYPNRVDGWLTRVGMLVPSALPWTLPKLEPLGRRGMRRFRAVLQRRGDLPAEQPGN